MVVSGKRDEILRELLGTTDVLEVELPGIVPRAVMLPAGVDPYWAWFGDGPGWSFLPREEWPREAAYPDAVSRLRPPSDPEESEDWIEGPRTTWSRPAGGEEPVGVVPWEVLADLRFFMRLAKHAPSSFYMLPTIDGNVSRLPKPEQRAVGPELAASKIEKLLHAFARSAEDAAKPLEAWSERAGLDAEDRHALALAIGAHTDATAEFEKAVRDVAASSTFPEMRRVAQTVRFSVMTNIDMPPYPSSGGREPGPALVVHAAHHLSQWERTVQRERAGRLPMRRVVQRCVRRTGSDVDFLSWLIPRVAFLEPGDVAWEPTAQKSSATSYWRTIASNYFKGLGAE